MPAGFESIAPPVAPRRPTSRTIHGHRLSDDYAWLADRGAPEAMAYLEAENEYADRVLEPLSGLQQELYEEFLSRIRETDLTVPVPIDDWLYYSRTERGQQYPIYCRRQRSPDGEDQRSPDGEDRRSPDGEETVLLDLNELASGREYVRLGSLEVSPDHRLLAFSVDASGGESHELFVKNLDSGELLADQLSGVADSVAWANDSSSLFYTVLDAARRPYKVLRHHLGGAGEDAVVYREDDGAFFVSLERSRSGAFVLITSASATTTEVLYVPADVPEATPTSIRPRCSGTEYYVEHRAESFYLLTNDEAKNFRLLRQPVGGDEPAEEILAHQQEVKLERVELFAEHLVVWQRRSGLPELVVCALARRTWRTVRLPEPVYTLRREPNPEFGTREFRLGYCSLVTPWTIFACDLETMALEALKVQEVPGDYDPSNYVTGRFETGGDETGVDGARVPVTWVHRAGLELDGSNPCLLYGYGSYGVVVDPVFSPSMVSLLERGFVYAVAHVRGGGLLGKRWHEEGRLLSKRNSFSDFVAVAESLVERGFTSTDRLAARGASAGGLLVAAALNLRPDLFRAAVARVPFVDVINTMLDASMPLTVIEYEEWGNPEKAAFFEYMLSYSPYDNVTRRDYPALFVTAGLNDPRVQYWEPAKWVAKLRALKSDDNPLLLRTDMGAGHGGPSGRYEMLRQRALEYAFLLDALDLGSV